MFSCISAVFRELRNYCETRETIATVGQKNNYNDELHKKHQINMTNSKSNNRNNMPRAKFSETDLRLINEVYKQKTLTEQDIRQMSRDEIIDLTDLLGGLIGYDKETNDIDELGRLADDAISTLLVLLEERGLM